MPVSYTDLYIFTSAFKGNNVRNLSLQEPDAGVGKNKRVPPVYS